MRPLPDIAMTDTDLELWDEKVSAMVSQQVYRCCVPTGVLPPAVFYDRSSETNIRDYQGHMASANEAAERGMQ